MTRQGQSITLSLAAVDKAKLEELATAFDMTWGEKPNISKLIKAIARNRLRIAPNHDWPQPRIQALERAYGALVDAGHLAEARLMAELLLDRSEINHPFRAKLTQFLDQAQPSWRKQLDQFIQRQQPFQLTYADASGRLWTFHVDYARIERLEKRQYLLCHCQETAGNLDLPALSHNWSFRLDRIHEAALAPLTRPWRGRLGAIAVTFDLYGGLALAYEHRPTDIETVLEGNPPRRRVTRPVESTFWFFREVAQYWEDCQIIDPPEVRERFVAKFLTLQERYGMTH